jgi:hypothetical protein
LYWALVTLTSTGYGDITPRNVGEVLYTMCIMVSNLYVYGYVVGTVSLTIEKSDEKEASNQKKLMMVNAATKEHKPPAAALRPQPGFPGSRPAPARGHAPAWACRSTLTSRRMP